MGKDLAENFPCASEVFKSVDEALHIHLSRIMWGDDTELLNHTVNTQPALLAVSIASLRVLESEVGFSMARECAYVAGHSLGEYSALVAVGALSVPEAARLLRTRGEAMQDAVPLGIGKMSAVLGLSIDDVADIAHAVSEKNNVCEIANDNSPTQVIISGHHEAVDRGGILAKERGAQRVIPLPVSAPFHCSLLQPAQDVMQEALAHVTLNPPCLPVVTNVTAQPISNPEDLRAGLIEQVTGTVRWRESILWMSNEGSVDTFFEIGAGSVLSGLIRRTVSGAHVEAIGSLESVKAIIESYSRSLN
jgi:[acyl-carrier-protein] S-malonyltransferase